MKEKNSEALAAALASGITLGLGLAGVYLVLDYDIFCLYFKAFMVLYATKLMLGPFYVKIIK